MHKFFFIKDDKDFIYDEFLNIFNNNYDDNLSTIFDALLSLL